MPVLLQLQLSYIRSDLEDMDFIMSPSENNLAERLLPAKYSFFIRESRYAVYFLFCLLILRTVEVFDTAFQRRKEIVICLFVTYIHEFLSL